MPLNFVYMFFSKKLFKWNLSEHNVENNSEKCENIYIMI